MLAPTTQDAVYSSTDYHELKHGASSEMRKLIIRHRTEKFRELAETTDSDVLEVGIGPGWNLIRMPAHRRVGQDVTLAYAEQLRAQGVEFVSDLSQLSGQQFDVVILSHVLEHLLEPAKKLAELREFLKPRGRLLLIVPLESPVRKVSKTDNNHHLFSWNVQTLNDLLDACGYAVTSSNVIRSGFDRFAAVVSVRLGGGFRLYKLLLLLLRTIRPCHEIQVIAVRKMADVESLAEPIELTA
jgi:SAM-dependent methyltransferase